MISTTPLTSFITQTTVVSVRKILTFQQLLLFSFLDKVMRGSMHRPLGKRLSRKCRTIMGSWKGWRVWLLGTASQLHSTFCPKSATGPSIWVFSTTNNAWESRQSFSVHSRTTSTRTSPTSTTISTTLWTSSSKRPVTSTCMISRSTVNTKVLLFFYHRIPPAIL